MFQICFFFFSSRRRHTRYIGDWSSDVCSSDLVFCRLIATAAADKKARGIVRLDIRQKTSIADYFVICEGDTDRQVRAIKIGRASCRERVERLARARWIKERRKTTWANRQRRRK